MTSTIAGEVVAAGGQVAVIPTSSEPIDAAVSVIPSGNEPPIGRFRVQVRSGQGRQMPGRFRLMSRLTPTTERCRSAPAEMLAPDVDRAADGQEPDLAGIGDGIAHERPVEFIGH